MKNYDKRWHTELIHVAAVTRLPAVVGSKNRFQTDFHGNFPFSIGVALLCSRIDLDLASYCLNNKYFFITQHKLLGIKI